MFNINSLTLTLLIASAPASAATITATSTINGVFSKTSTVDTATGPTTVGEGQVFEGTSNADLLATSANVDISSGELKVRVEAQGVGTTSPLESVQARSIMSENVTVSGLGSVTFTLNYDGFWGLEKIIGQQNALFDVVAGISIDEGQGFILNDPLSAFQSVANNRDNPWAGSTVGSLSVTTDIDGSKIFDITASLFASIGSGNGYLDFSNTGVLGITTTGTVDVRYADTRFLSGEPISAVPLPAGLPLFLTAISVMGLACWKNTYQGS